MKPTQVNRPDHANTMLLDMQAMPMFEQMQHNGLLVDPAKLSALDKLIIETKRTEEEAMLLALGEVLFSGLNPGSDPQVAKLLFVDLEISNHGVKLTKSKARESVAKSELAKLAADHPVIPPLQRWRELDTLEDTFVKKLPRMLRPNKRVYPQVLYTRTATGRPASKEPNLLNIPVRSELGREIRKAFVAPPGTRLVTADFSQIELRILAHESQDVAMLETYRTGGDIHETTRQRVFGDATSEASKARQRKRAKNLNFGVVFGITAVGYREQILVEGGDPAVWTEQRCQQDIDGMWLAYPGAKQLIDETHRLIRRFGYTWDMWGRLRQVPHIRSVHSWIREQALREGGNHRIQAGAAGIMKRGMADVSPVADSYDREPDIVCRPLLQIYDQLLFEVSAGEAEEFAEEMRDQLRFAAGLSVPIEVDIGVGDNWGDL